MRKEIQIMTFKVMEVNKSWPRELKSYEAEMVAMILLGVRCTEKIGDKKTRQFYERTVARIKPLIEA